MFLMLTDTSKGPLEPIWVALGLRDFTWVTDPGWPARPSSSGTRGSGRRSCSSSCWPPSRASTRRSGRRRSPTAPAAGRRSAHHLASHPAGDDDDHPHPAHRGLQDHRHAEHPARRRAGTATQSMTLQAYIDWNTLNLGRSAAVAYLLLLLTVRRPCTSRSATGDGDGMSNPFRRRSAADLSVRRRSSRSSCSAPGPSSCCSRSTGWS